MREVINNKKFIVPTNAQIIENILKKEDYKDYLPTEAQNENMRKIVTGTVISALYALSKNLEGEIDRMGLSFTDSMVSDGRGAAGLNIRKIYTMNHYMQVLTTGECNYIDFVARYVNFVSRYMESIRCSELGLEHDDASMKLDESVIILHELMSYNPEGVGIFVINGQEDDGRISVLKVDYGGLIDYNKSDLEEQNVGTVEDWPMSYPTSGCGTGETRTAYNLLFSIRNNHYNMVPMKKVYENTALVSGVLATLSAFHTQPGATAWVGGHIYVSYMKKGNHRSPETGFFKLDGLKAKELREFLPYVTYKLDYDETSDEFKENFKVEVDEEKLEEILKEKVNECVADYGHKIRHDNTKSLIKAGGYNKDLVYGIIKNPEQVSINQKLEGTKTQIKAVYKPITDTFLKSLKKKARERHSRSLPTGDILNMFAQFNITMEKEGCFIAVAEGERILDDDEKEYYKKQAVPSVVVLRYLSDNELNSPENVFPVTTYNNSKFGITSIAVDNNLISRQIELGLYKTFLQQVSEFENQNLEGIMADVFEYPVKSYLNIEAAKVDSRFATSGFESIGFKATDKSIQIIKTNPLGVFEHGPVITSGEKDMAFLVRKILEELKTNNASKDHAFKHDYVLPTMLVSLYKGLLEKKKKELKNTNKKMTATVKKEIWIDIRKRTRMYNFAKECEMRNSKVSQEKINELVDVLQTIY
jgi:hypothetical protein